MSSLVPEFKKNLNNFENYIFKYTYKHFKYRQTVCVGIYAYRTCFPSLSRLIVWPFLSLFQISVLYRFEL